jgi:hypothetical protein
MACGFKSISLMPSEVLEFFAFLLFLIFAAQTSRRYNLHIVTLYTSSHHTLTSRLTVHAKTKLINIIRSACYWLALVSER